MPAWLLFLLIALPCASVPAQPRAGAGTLADALNAIRLRGCGGLAGGVSRPFEESPALVRAARFVAGGASLADALAQASYKAQQSALVALEGPQQPAAVAAFLAQRYCQHLLRPEFGEMGSFHSGRRTWIVLAAAFAPPSVDDAQLVAKTVLQLVNQARAQPRRCGERAMGAAPAVRLNQTLNAAALGHARDMARNGYFDHTGRDGSKPADRATRAGYRWRAIGENIAAGQATAQAAMDGWLKSPGHCINLMQPGYQEMGVAFAVNRGSESGIYWTQLFGSPR